MTPKQQAQKRWYEKNKDAYRHACGRLRLYGYWSDNVETRCQVRADTQDFLYRYLTDDESGSTKDELEEMISIVPEFFSDREALCPWWGESILHCFCKKNAEGRFVWTEADKVKMLEILERALQHRVRHPSRREREAGRSRPASAGTSSATGC